MSGVFAAAIILAGAFVAWWMLEHQTHKRRRHPKDCGCWMCSQNRRTRINKLVDADKSPRWQ